MSVQDRNQFATAPPSRAVLAHCDATFRHDSTLSLPELVPLPQLPQPNRYESFAYSNAQPHTRRQSPQRVNHPATFHNVYLTLPLQDALRPPQRSPQHSTASRALHPDILTTDQVSQMTALLERFGFDVVRRLDPTPYVSPAASGSFSESAPLLQHSASRHTAPLDTGAAGYCADAPAPDHRTGSHAAPPPPALRTPTPRLAPPPPAWDEKDRDLLLKSANRQRYIETSGIRIRAFVEEAENFLEMCGRPRDRWSRFILS